MDWNWSGFLDGGFGGKIWVDWVRGRMGGAHEAGKCSGLREGRGLGGRTDG